MATITHRAVDLDVRPLSATIGAEIRGIDLKAPLSDEAIGAIYDVLLDRKVVFFPGQHLDAAEHVSFAGRFGELTPAHPVIPGIPGHPEVFEIDYSLARTLGLGDRTRYDGTSWHTDVTFVERPPLGSILNAVVIPPAGGDTQFSDQHAAYEGLSEPIRRLVDGLTAVHSGERTFGAFVRASTEGVEWEGETVSSLEPVEHPLVRTHPETGRRSLFVNPGFTTHIKGLNPSESDALHALLYQHSDHDPEYTVRYHWAAGDLGFWDNRVTQHSVVTDFGEQPRVIQRVTIRGDRPV